MKIVAYTSALLFSTSCVSALPACSVHVAQQQQQQQPQQQQQQGQCTMDMLKGFMITSPVNFVAQPQQILPERGQFIDPTNTTILMTDQQGGGQNETMPVKFTNETEISTEVLQNSIFAISWMRTGGDQQSQQQKINPIRVQLVSQDGKLLNVTETLGALTTGGQQQQQQQQQQSGQQQGNQTATPQVQASQQQQGNQTAVTPPQPGQQQGNETARQQGQSGAVVVHLGPKIQPGMYAFLLSAQVQPQQQGGQQQQQQQQQQQGPLCKVMTMPFRIRSASDLQQSGATNATATA